MKRKTLFLSLGCVLSCTVLTLSCVLITKNGLDQRVKGTDDFYSITINPADVTTSETYVDGSFSVYTDQLHNSVNLKYTQAGVSGGYLYLQGNDAGTLYNDIGENTEVRGMNSILIKGGNSSIVVDYGYRDGSSIDYIGYVSDTAIPAGTEYSFGTKKPNYFRIKSGSMSPAEIHQIVIKYGKECEAGENPEPAFNGIRYSLRDGNHYAVSGFAGSSFANVVLEDEINGLPVTEIWTNAFSNDHTIETINLKNITMVRYSAFKNCSHLSSIGNYSKITTFESYCFQNCSALAGDFSFTASNISFYNGAFMDCESITSVRFEDGCNAEMSSASFRDMDELTTLYIGDSVSQCDNFLFNSKLATITVSEDNTKYTAIDNVLYEKSGASLYLIRMAQVRAQTTYNMPANVTQLLNYCCFGCETLETVVTNDSINAIPDYAFDGCTALTDFTFGANVASIGGYAFNLCGFSTITIPASVKTIDSVAFRLCNNLVSVVFEEGCTKVCGQAFSDCNLLSSVILPATLDYAGVAGGFDAGAIFDNCPSLAAICTRLTSGAPAHADANWLGGKTLLYYSDVENNDGAHWHEVGSNNAPRVWSAKLYIQSNAEFSGAGAWYAVWAWTKGQSNGAFYYDSAAPVDYLYSITVPTDKNCFIVLRMKSGVDASTISAFPDGKFHNQTDNLEDVLANQITITQWDNGMGGGNLGISYSLKAAA